MIVLHLLQLYSVKSQGDAAMSTGVKSFQYSTDIYIFLSWSMRSNASAVRRSSPIQDRGYVLSRLSVLKLRSAEADDTGIVNRTQNTFCKFG